MNKVNWELIIINNDEFKCYLSNYDLKELSKISKLVRLKLKHKIFENILINNNIELLVEEEFDKTSFNDDYHTDDVYEIPIMDYTTLFNRCLKRFLPYIKHINFKTYASHYHLLEVSNLLPNLTILSTFGATLGLTAFINSLNNLKSLKTLKIEAIHFIQYRGESDRFTRIKLPLYLKYIKWQHCSVSISYLEEDPQSINFNYNQTLSEHNVFQFEPHNFPNLYRFSTQLLMPTFSIDFFLNNPQITRVNFLITIFNNDALYALSLITNIKTMKICVDHLHSNLNDANIKYLELNSLCFYRADFRNWPLFELIVNSSPNLLDIRIDLIFDKGPPLIELINKLQNLKKLTIKSTTCINLKLEDLSHSSRLKCLEIWIEMDINSVLMSLSSHSNLEVICFRKEFFSTDYLLCLEQEITPEPWKLVSIGGFIKYYR